MDVGVKGVGVDYTAERAHDPRSRVTVVRAQVTGIYVTQPRCWTAIGVEIGVGELLRIRKARRVRRNWLIWIEVVLTGERLFFLLEREQLANRNSRHHP